MACRAWSPPLVRVDGPFRSRLTGMQSADGARCDLWGWGVVGFRASWTPRRPDPQHRALRGHAERLSQGSACTAAQSPWRPLPGVPPPLHQAALSAAERPLSLASDPQEGGDPRKLEPVGPVFSERLLC